MAIRVDADEPFHVLIGQSVVEMSLDALDDAYHGEVIIDETLIWQEGLGEWLRLDVVLHRLAQQDENENAIYSLPAPPPESDVYFVLLGGDDTKQMTLDQLDDAYRLDVVDEATLVWQPGFAEWIALSELLSLEQEAPVVSPAFYPPAQERMHVSSAPYGAPWSRQASSGYAAPSSGYILGRPADSTRPVTSNVMPTIAELTPPPASPWYRRSLVGAAAAVALFSAHQYGLTHAVAGAVGKDAALSAALGGPNLNTPSGLEQWLGTLSRENHLEHLAETEPVVAPKKAAAPALVSPAGPIQPAAAQPQTPAAAAPPVAASTAAAPESPALSDTLPTGDSSKFSNTLQGKKTPVIDNSKAKTKSTGKAPRGSGLAYDPMNGTL